MGQFQGILRSLLEQCSLILWANLIYKFTRHVNYPKMMHTKFPLAVFVIGKGSRTLSKYFSIYSFAVVYTIRLPNLKGLKLQQLSRSPPLSLSQLTVAVLPLSCTCLCTRNKKLWVYHNNNCSQAQHLLISVNHMTQLVFETSHKSCGPWVIIVYFMVWEKEGGIFAYRSRDIGQTRLWLRGCVLFPILPSSEICEPNRVLQTALPGC